MAALNNSRATLRFFGEDLDPAKLTEILGVKPTDMYEKGQVRISSTGNHFTYRRGMWRLEAKDKTPGDLEAQIKELLSVLPQDLQIWRQLALQHEIDLFCGLFMEESNEGFSLNSDSLNALSARGISIDFEVYAPSSEESAPQLAPGEA
jgi:Domain of unknown function (DUF4279)